MVKRISHAIQEKQEFSRTENGDAENKKMKKEVMLLTNLLHRLRSVKLIRLKNRLK